MRVGNGSVPPFCDMNWVNCGTMKVMKTVMRVAPARGKEGGINQRLLDAIAQIFGLHQTLHQPHENIRECAARFARRDKIHIKRRENTRETPSTPEKN